MNEATHPELAALLRAQTPRILERWAARARECIPPAGGASGSVLVDSLPDVLEAVAAALASGPAAPALEREAELGADHGALRARHTEFSLDQVLTEYELLHRLVLDALREAGPLPAAAVERVGQSVFVALRASARGFTQLRDDERAAAQETLRRANEELEQRVERRVAELHLAEERFTHFVDSVKDYAIFTLDAAGVITSWNAGCHRMKGFAADEAIGNHYEMLYPEEGKRRNEPDDHLRVAASEGRFRGEGVRQRKNGELFLADVSITPIHVGDRHVGFTKVVQDLTERNLLMQERDLSRTDAAAMRMEAEYRERFVAALTHDLRSPLSTALTGAHLIARAPDDVERVREWAQRIGSAVSRTDRMISDLLDASRLQAGERLPLDVAPCDLRPLVEELRAEFTDKHGDRFVVETEGPTVGVWGLEGLRRVFENLLGNAVKYGDPREPITVRLRRVDNRLLIAVHNQGTIIPLEDQAKLFEPFHRTPLAERSGKIGWGIGLTLVKGIVEAHGGVVKVESYPKSGTTFTVDLPVDARPGARAT